jgi:hypothetical protein
MAVYPKVMRRGGAADSLPALGKLALRDAELGDRLYSRSLSGLSCAAAIALPRSVRSLPAFHAAVCVSELSARLFSHSSRTRRRPAFTRSIMLLRFPFSSLAQLFGCLALVGAQLGHERTVSTR